MNVYSGQNLTNDEIYFNKRIQSARSLVERVIGLLRNRFRCLHKERKLRYYPTKASKIINSCATLHNFLIRRQLNIQPNLNEVHYLNFINIQNQQEIDRITANRNIATRMRNELKDLLLLQRI